MMGAPSPIAEGQLNELSLRIVKRQPERVTARSIA